MLPLHNLNLNSARRRAIFATSLILGVLLVIQSRSFQGLEAIHTRDAASNIFRELQVLRDTNKNLSGEITSLEEVYNKTKDSSLSIQALEEEIQKFKVINGGVAVHGPGTRVTLPDGTDIASIVDLLNELNSSGAEVISINGVRLVGNSFGIDGIPSGQILLHGNILQSPYVISAIGDSTTMENALRQVGGLLRRYEKTHPGKTLKIEKRDRIDVEKV